MSRPVHYHTDGFPPDGVDWPRLMPLIGRAHAALARYDGLVAAIPNARVLLSPLMTHEAVLSSKIEGTSATMSEVLEIEAGANGDDVTPAKRDDAEEILNYRKALLFAVDSLHDRPFSLHLLREAHALLMDGVRGRNKSPGAFRTGQNYIGGGRGLGEASFVPIPLEHLRDGMDRWSHYMLGVEEPDPLVQLAIAHVEFEALHPFLDGNGRVGRMIIPLFLYWRDILTGPNFYISGYFETRREEYIERLRAVSRDGAWTDWCEFFLHGLIEQATDNQAKARKIIDLYRHMQREMPDLTHSQHTAGAVDFIFSRLVFSSSDFAMRAGIPKATALRILGILRREDVVRTVVEAAGRRPAIYVFGQLLNIVEGEVLL